ncbi:MAG: long-chain fatty acid--CoA ligase [Deltaproteobacteria bacterium]|nr:long-chain fatty acid--CoA ligase [Deltaproteobacteria bacterium]
MQDKPQPLYDPPTVPGMFMHQAHRLGDRVLRVSKQDGVWKPTTWAEAYAGLRALTMGLVSCGIRKGNRVGIVSRTRYEWSDADFAVLCSGGITVGIYPTASVAEMEHILVHSGCRLLFVENDELLGRMEEIRRKTGLPERMVLFETKRERLPDGAILSTELLRLGRELDLREPGRFDETWRAVAPDDLATIAYTSGTTGPPKGAMITHANLYFTAINAVTTQNLNRDDFGIAYLPLTHMLQRLTVYAVLHAEVRGVYAESIEKLIDNFRELKPTIQVGVPRIFEKIHARIMQKVAEASPLRQRIFAWAMRVGSLASPYRKEKKRMPVTLALRHTLADRLVFRPIREVFGGRVKHLVCGGAPMPLELLEFFYASGLLILEGYGLTETVAPVSVNRPDEFRFGTVGRLIEGVEARLGAGNELLLRGQGLFRGYYRDPEATTLAIDADGWFHSGDIAEIDRDGFIRITDRKKDIIVTAGGKNIAPQNIETLIKALPIIGNVMVHGDGRSHLTALITLDGMEIRDWAAREGIVEASSAALAAHPAVRRSVEEWIAAVNARLAPYEAIRRFAILPSDFTEAAGELTPTLKIRRREIARKYAELLDSLYG